MANLNSFEIWKSWFVLGGPKSLLLIKNVFHGKFVYLGKSFFQYQGSVKKIPIFWNAGLGMCKPSDTVDSGLSAYYLDLKPGVWLTVT